MWAVAAQPRTGLTPMIPTPSVDSDIASGLRLAVHAQHAWAEWLVPTGPLDLFDNACHLERLRGTVMDLGSGRDQVQDDPLRLPGVRGAEHADSVCLESGDGPRNTVIVRHRGE